MVSATATTDKSREQYNKRYDFYIHVGLYLSG
jgi:hypothetical protein